jgi:hypothetical protein
MTQTITKRLILNQARDGHFCGVCGVPATNACKDAREVRSEAPSPIENGATATTDWVANAERYGCDSHPVTATLYFEDGRSVAAKDFHGN